eukprot:maker-scaffold261_size233860-snap-gene-1.29 protein:Tk10694 transcript:maker-scaffold261_size233860-snap-gene-1.29-mRNA-1 annotation:"hypothetical protein TcasGA2_TC000296"
MADESIRTVRFDSIHSPESIPPVRAMPTQNPRASNYTTLSRIRHGSLGGIGFERALPGHSLDPEQLEGPEYDDQDESSKRPKLPLVERIWNYIKDTWTGVTGSEPILEDLELPHRYRPQNLKTLCDATGISEMKRIYRGFKTECPSGLITEEAFHSIYSRFYPHGAALSSYSHYVFSTLDRNDSGVITFQDFVVGLSILIRGTLEEKLRWTFSLYDQDRDGVISREEMEDVVGSVFDLMGRTGDPVAEEAIVAERVDQIFQKMDLNGDGVVSIEEFLETCQNDETISRSVQAFTNVVI